MRGDRGNERGRGKERGQGEQEGTGGTRGDRGGREGTGENTIIMLSAPHKATAGGYVNYVQMEVYIFFIHVFCVVCCIQLNSSQHIVCTHRMLRACE